MIRIRPFSPTDVETVAGIVRESLRENYPTSLYLDLHRWWRDGFLVAENAGDVIGFLAAVVSAPQVARILMIAVTAPWRRRRIGTLLMNAFLRECGMRGMRAVELEVRKSNVGAIAFYTRYGFEIAHALPKFYTDGEDGYKMRRHL